MGTPLVEGRDFNRSDLLDKTRVAIVNQRFARHFFGDKSALGRHIGWGNGPGTKLEIEIVGEADRKKITQLGLDDLDADVASHFLNSLDALRVVMCDEVVNGCPQRLLSKQDHPL